MNNSKSTLPVKNSQVKTSFRYVGLSTWFEIPQQICVFLIPCGVTPLHHINESLSPPNINLSNEEILKNDWQEKLF